MAEIDSIVQVELGRIVWMEQARCLTSWKLATH